MERAQWGSKIGFILAAAGSAIGLGALWRFPYMIAEHGGGAFLIVFLIMTVFIGLPLLISEFIIGKASKKSPIEGFQLLGGRKFYGVFGHIGNVAVFLLLSFYSVIGGWLLIYFVVSLLTLFNLMTVSDYGNLFDLVISNPLYAIGAQGLFIFLTALIVTRGVEKGLERASKIMMPLLFILFLIIIVRSLTLPGAMEGVTFFLDPNFGGLNAEAILYALGQSFFALSVGATTMMTYASYTNEKMNITQSAVSIVLLNVTISILAGLAIFPALFSLEIESTHGPGLVFVALPAIFSVIPLGDIVFVLFIIAFLFATVTSSISMLEINVANWTKGDETLRKKRSYIVALLVFIAGIPSALSYGVLADLQLFGRTIFDNVDFLVSNILLPIGAFFVAIFVGYIMDKRIVMQQLELRRSEHLFLKIFIFLLKFILPVLILAVFILQIITL